MKILFTCLPDPSHFHHMAPLAWALRTAGHEVRVASESELTDTITESGLTAVVIGRAEAEWATNDPEAMILLEDFYNEGLMYTYGFDWAAARTGRWTFEELLSLENVMVPALIAGINTDSVIDDLVAFARTWRPDLVIWEQYTYAGAIAASVTGAAHARLLYIPDATVRARQEFLHQAASRLAEHREDPTAEWLEWTLQRFGCHFDEEIMTGQWTIDATPTGMRLEGLGLRSIEMRYVPYHGPAMVPDWMHKPLRHRRVCASFGLSGITEDPGELVAIISRATEDLGIEVIMTLEDGELDPTPVIPDYVRLAGFVPLNEMLPTCSAIIHHGGPGTLMTAQLHGVPQVILPLLETSIIEVSAKRVQELGTGLVIPFQNLTVAGLREGIIRVLNEQSFAQNAERIRQEMLDKPSPNDIVPLLEKLTDEHRTTPVLVNSGDACAAGEFRR